MQSDRYELLELTAQGGMGHVYRARDRATSAIVAVKVLSPEGGDPERFAREASVLSSLTHPSIVRYLDHGTSIEGAPFLVMEWLSGEDLGERLSSTLLSIDDTITLASTLSEALSLAHDRGIVHRDLKPANIFLVDKRVSSATLVDFGLACASADSSLSKPGFTLGTPAYMSPEQVRGGVVDARADVYSLGGVLFRCLTGRAPFRGNHDIAILAKVVVERPPDVRELRPETPAALADLVARMLLKDPALRPANGAALLEELSRVRDGGAREKPPALGITTQEQRIACIALCAGEAGDRTVPIKGAAAASDALRAAVLARGGTLDPLARGAWLVSIEGASSAGEQASRAARCALALASIRHAPVVVATGRFVRVGEAHFGEVIDRATEVLLEASRSAPTAGVLVDEATATLLEPDFELRGEGGFRRLVGERKVIAPARTLLGRPARCFGRERELAALAASLDECKRDSTARAVLITAPAALGKTRLVHELLNTGVAARDDVEVLYARCDALRAGSPFGVVAEVLLRAAFVDDSASAEARARSLVAMVERSFEGREARRMHEFLGELMAIPTPQSEASAELRAARLDSRLMGDAVREAWARWLAVRCDRGPVLLVIEDLHWADRPSLRLLDAALAACGSRPLMVLATARPELRRASPQLFRAHRLIELELRALDDESARQLVRTTLGDSIGDAEIAAIVARATGHPFHLEELVRAIAEGRGAAALPDSILGMLQARLDVLDARERRVLRAASVFGETFVPAAVAALMGNPDDARDVERMLRRLAEREVVTRRSTEYAFRHSLLRDAAYAMLTDDDRTLAHRLAGEWLERHGQTDPAVLAEHYERGKTPERALISFRRAAEQALAGDDFERAMSHAERALSCGPSEATKGALLAVQAEVMFWRGELDAAAERASRSLEGLPEGTPSWFDAISVTLAADGQRGRNDGVASCLERASLSISAPEARGAHVVSLCKGLLQLFWAHYRGDLSAVRARLDALVDESGALGPYETAWVERVRGESAWLHDAAVDRCLHELDASCASFERARALRSLCLTRLNAATLRGWSGEVDEGLALVDRCHADASRLGSVFLIDYTSAVRGLLEAYGARDGAEATMRGALSGVRGSPRLSFICHVVLGWIAVDRGDLDVAEANARAAVALPVVADLASAGHAVLARVSVARGELDRALEQATTAIALVSQRRDLELTEGVAELSMAEVLHARGERDAARRLLAGAERRVLTIAAQIGDPLRRARYVERRFPNARIRLLSNAWNS